MEAQTSSRLVSGWVGQAEAGGAKWLSELETGSLRAKLPQTAGGQEAGELGLHLAQWTGTSSRSGSHRFA